MGYRFTAEATGPLFARVRSEELTALGIGFQVMRDGSDDRATTQEISGSQHVYAGDQVTILVNNAAPETGRFTLSVQQAAATPIGNSETVNGTIDVERPIAYAIRGSTSARYITAQVTQNGLLIADISRDFGQLSAARQPAAGAVLTSGTATIPQDGPVNVRVHASTALDSAESLTVEVEVAPVE